MTNTSGATDVLIVAAHAPELVGFRGEFSESMRATIRGLSIRAATIGVGMPAAGASIGRRLEELKPRVVVLVGSCGVYPSRAAVRPLDVLISERVVLLDSAVVLGKAAYPAPMQISVEAHAGLRRGLEAIELGQGERIQSAVIGTTLAITTDDGLASAVGESGVCDAENLEAFAIALACAQRDVPFVAVLGVTNLVGSTGRTDWVRYQRQAALATGDLVLRWLHNGAQGLAHG